MNFEQQFTYFFYQNLLEIIGDSSKLKEAAGGFQQSCIRSDNSRYLCKEKFGLQKWSDENAANFSGAVAEALKLTTEQFQFNCLKEVQDASDNIKTKIAPSLAERANTAAPHDPFLKLRDVISGAMGDLRAKKYNRYQLFAIAATVVVTLGVTAAVALGANQSK
ncbi:MAG: hypothetical protein Q8M03_03610 [Legionella sp.]|nr:hypothetical protein [Legionella sp.]